MTRTKKWFARAAVAFIAVTGGMLVSPASPAEAGTCSTKGCGGAVINNTKRVVYVTNCWLSGNPGIWYGSVPSCATNGYDVTKANSYYGLGPNQNTDSFSKYYDTDALRVDNGCTLTFYNGIENQTWSARGVGSHLWVKITSDITARVNSYVC